MNNEKPCLQGLNQGPGKDPGHFYRLEECEKAGLESGPKEWCEELHTCHSCTAHQGCRWESEKVGKCRQSTKSAAQIAPSAGGSINDEEPGKSTLCFTLILQYVLRLTRSTLLAVPSFARC